MTALVLSYSYRYSLSLGVTSNPSMAVIAGITIEYKY
jgi:hypothetical protein